MLRKLSYVLGWVVVASAPARAEEPLRNQAARGLRKAVEAYRAGVATGGGYLWRYSEDLARREGEAKATATQVWVQPPGTPSVGLAYLAAYEATGDAYYLGAAREAAGALLRGQLRSGGWDYSIEFDPALRGRFAYRADPGSDKGRNVTTLDDNNTQAAVRLLMRVDKALQCKDAAVREAAEFALASLLKAQYPNGSWPQRYDRSPDPDRFPVKKAAYPESWPRTHPAQDYRGHYTFNDNTLADVIDVMLEAEQVYGAAKYRAAAAKAGDFILLAQMPEPQPAWAQQYDAAMHPAWARKFEPPAVTGGESQGVLRTLLVLYRATGDKKYLEPIPRALAWFRRSRLPDGRLARFYELKTNKPLYFTRDYQLTYDDSDMPTHYSFKVGDRTEALNREYRQLLQADPAELKKPPVRPRPRGGAALEGQVKDILAAQNAQGLWVTAGRLRYHGPDDPARRILDVQALIRNVETLSQYLAATKPSK